MPIYNSTTADKTDLMGVVVDPSGALSHRLDFRGRNRASSTPAGSVVAGATAQVGTGATISLVAGSTDDIGTILINTGTGTSAAGLICTLTFHDAWVTAPFVQLQARDQFGAAAIYYVTTTTTTMVVSTTNILAASQAVKFDYDCTGGQ